jgi:hypothetical protein
MIDTVPSSQRGLRHLLRRFSLCSEGKGVQLLFRSPLPETRPSPLISVAIWGRDVRIVVLTGLFWLANLAGSFYGKDYFRFRARDSDSSIRSSHTGSILHFFPINLSSADMTSCSGSHRMVSSSADVCHQWHRRVQVEHPDQLC